MNLKDNIAIVTGGSEGIGLGIASALAKEGVLVYLIARTQEKLDIAQKIIIDNKGRAKTRSADITNVQSIKDIIDEVYKDNKRLDIFVNNAGTWRPYTISTPFEEIKKILQLDFTAPYEITQYLAQKFSKEKNNHLKILTVLSQAALQVMSSGMGYGPAKMGLTSGLFHIQKELEISKKNNIELYRLYPNTVGTKSALPLIKKGALQNATSLDSVVSAALDLLQGKTPTRDLRIGYQPGKGIVRTHLPSNPEHFYIHKGTEEEVDPDFIPQDLIK